MDHDQERRQEDLIQRVQGVPVEAAHRVMALSDLVWLFGSRMSRWNKPHLLIAAEHFGLSRVPEVSLRASQYEQELLVSVVRHLQANPSHRFVVLYRQGTWKEGWVCLVPTGDFPRVQQVLAVHQLELSPAGRDDVLQ